MEEGDDSALKLRSSARVDRRRREGLPHDRLADVGGDEERRAAAKAVALAQQVIQKANHDRGSEELADDESGGEAADGES